MRRGGMHVWEEVVMHSDEVSGAVDGGNEEPLSLT